MKKAFQWSIGVKLWILSGCMLFNLLFVGSLSLWNARSLVSQLNEVGDVHLIAVRNMTLLDMMHDGIRANVYHGLVAAYSKDEEAFPEIKKEGEEFSKNIRAYVKTIEGLEIPKETHDAIEPVFPKVENYIKSANDVLKFAVAGDIHGANTALPEFNKRFTELEEDLGKLGDLIEENAKASVTEGHNLSELANKLSVGLVAASLLLGLWLSTWIIRNLQSTLSKIIQTLGEESETVAKTSGNMNRSSEQLMVSTTQQASALQETAASIEEITAMVTKTGESSKKLDQIAENSSESAVRGQNSIKQMLSAVEEIRQSQGKVLSQVEAGNQKMFEISRVIADIGDKTKVINDIVFQTKLLSFNASVEAARAGEHGKGFAVVAEEVGNLAQMSGNAAKEISDMLSSSVHRVESIISESKRVVEGLIAEGQTKLNLGADVASQCGGELDEIVQQSTDVSAMVSEISSAIHEQVQGIQEISKAIQLLDKSTQENTLTAKQTSESSSELMRQSHSLNEIVNELQRLIAQSKTSTKTTEESGATPNSSVTKLKTEDQSSEDDVSKAA